jgi:hypothetical protein
VYEAVQLGPDSQGADDGGHGDREERVAVLFLAGFPRLHGGVLGAHQAQHILDVQLFLVVDGRFVSAAHHIGHEGVERVLLAQPDAVGTVDEKHEIHYIAGGLPGKARAELGGAGAVLKKSGKNPGISRRACYTVGMDIVPILQSRRPKGWHLSAETFHSTEF